MRHQIESSKRQRAWRSVGASVKHLLVAVFVLLLALVPAIAFADDVPAPTTLPLSFLREAIDESNPVEEALTDPQVSREMPHHNLSREEAVGLTEAVFAPILEAAAGPIQGLEADKYLSDHAAIVPAADEGAAAAAINGTGTQSEATGEGEPVLLESSLPLRTEGEDGQAEPVDLSLEQGGGQLEPAAPLVEVRLPQALGEGIELPDAGVGIQLAEAPGDRAPSIVNGTAASYPNVSADTDFTVAPTPTGVETLTTLRSPEADPSQTLELDLPPGASVAATNSGGAEVTRGDDTLVNVPAPTAIDANGNGVPVSLAVSGNALTVTAEPQAGTAYPVLVDPLFEAYDWFYFRNLVGQDTWHFQNNVSGIWAEASDEGPKIVAQAGHYNLNDQGDYWYYVPRLKADEAEGVTPTSFVQQMTVWHVGFITDQTAGSPFSPYMLSGILGSAGWVTGEGGTAVWTYRGNAPGFWQLHSEAGNGVLLNFINGTPAKRDTSAKMALGLGLASIESTWTNYARYGRMGAAAVYIGDEDLPKPANGSSTPWVNQTASTPLTAEAKDAGLGVKSINFEVPGQGTKSAVNPCLGTASSPCPRSWTGSVPAANYNPATMPQGINQVPMYAEDALGNKSGNTEKAYIRVDHSKPGLALSGTLTEQAKLGTTLPQYTLKYVATDGSEGAFQSGVVSTEVKVDGTLVEPKYAPGCSSSNCSVSKEWVMKASSYAAGTHNVEVIATDGVNLQTTEKRSFTIAADKTGPQLKPTGTLYSAPEGWVEQKSYTVNVSAEDPGGYGVTSLVLKIDGATVKSATGTCPNGGCTKSIVASLNMATYKGGEHEAELIATDGNGNVAKKSWTINVDPKGSVAAGETTDTVEAVEGTEPETYAVAPTSEVIGIEERTEGNNPGLEKVGSGEWASTGTPVESTVVTGSEEAMIIGATKGEVEITPVGTPSTATPVVVENVAAVLPNTAKGTDTVVRPRYNGLLDFQTIRESTSPEQHSWEVSLLPGATLKPLEEGFAGVFYEDGSQMMLIEAMPAHDATGKAVPTKLTVTAPNIVTLTVEHTKASYVYPVLTGPAFEVGYSTVEVTGLPPEEGPEESTWYWSSPPRPVPVADPDAEGGGASSSSVVHKTKVAESKMRKCQTYYCPVGFWEAWLEEAFLFNGKEHIYNGAQAWHDNEYSYHHCQNYSTTAPYSIEVNGCTWIGNHAHYSKLGHYMCAQEVFHVSEHAQNNYHAMTFHNFGDGYAGPHQNSDCQVYID